MGGTWTIGELAERAAAALATNGAAQVSGRVRDLPNARLIRWYTTIGLVDPPLGRRGRTALYGPRHLRQLVAVKRRQAAGRSIAEIQVELAAATDETLARIAALPGDAPSPMPPTPGAAARTGSPAAETHDTAPGNTTKPHPSPPTPAPATPSTAAPATASPAAAAGPSAVGPDAAVAGGAPQGPADGAADGAAEGSTGGRRESPAGGEPGTGAGERGAFWSTRPDVSYGKATVSADYGRPLPPVVHGVRLAPGLTLLLEGAHLSDDDLAAIDSAARPLLDELHRRGLLTPAESPAVPPAAHFRRSL